MKFSAKGAAAAGQFWKERDYWLNKLSGDLVKTGFPFTKTGTVKSDAPLEAETFRIGDELFSRLMKVGNQADARLHIILAAGISLLLNRCTGIKDIIVGTPIYRQDVEGQLINSVIALRNRLEPALTFKELLFQVNRTLLEAAENQNYPMESLLYQLGMKEDEDGFPLFDVVVMLENIHEKKYIRHINPNTIFSFTRKDEYIEGELAYNPGKYDNKAARRIITHFTHLLHEAIFNVNMEISSLEMLPADEKKRILYDFNDTGADYPRDQTITGLFASRVNRSPGNPALVLGDERMSYLELAGAADRVAGILRAKGVKPGSIVALLLERSLEMVVGILGILKAGGAYLPIDPDNPAERINYMLKDSNAKILMKKSEIRISKYETNPNDQNSNDRNDTSNLIVLDFEHLNFEFVSDFEFRASNLSPSNLSYIIYTSGTTGNPKGVMIEHRNVVRLLFNDRFQFNFSGSDVWTLFHSYCFDFSVWEMYGALLYGGELVLISKMDARDPGRCLKLLKERNVTVLNQTPSAFYNLLNEELACADKQLRLRYVIFGGEALKPGKLKGWREKYPGTRLVNMYGITETTVHVTYKEIGEEEIRENISNIGRCIPTLYGYVLDGNLRLLPVGVSGELCIGGEGVGRGYLNRPQLTAERFVADIYKRGEAGRLYRSGDLVKVLENGEMEYLGRVDHQVKVRGFRVELGEIEGKLLKHKEIEEAVVLAREDGEQDRSLCAYIVGQREFAAWELRKYLLDELPDYMVPAYFFQLEEIPLTANGKVDGKKLLQSLGRLDEPDDYIAPSTPVQEKLVDVWQDVLKLPKIGVKNDFFNLGGDSIKAIRLLNLVNAQFHSSIKIADLYGDGTIEAMADKIDIGEDKTVDEGLSHRQRAGVEAEVEALKNRVLEGNEPLTPGNVEDLYPMSDIQKGMVFHTLADPGGSVYSLQMVYHLTYPGFDAPLFQRALILLTKKHSILRAGFNIEDFEEPVQVVYKNIRLDNRHEELVTLEREQREEHVSAYLVEDRKQPFDLAEPPLWRLRTFDLGGEEILILFSAHHAIVDGWSVASLMTELNNTYQELKADPAFRPRPLKYTYKQFVIEQVVEKRKDEIRDFWRGELQGYKRLDFDLTGNMRNPGRVREDVPREIKNYNLQLGGEFLRAVKDAADRLRTPVKALCFGAYIYMLGMFSYDDEFVVGLITNNRPLCEDGEKIIGCFLNTTPFRVVLPLDISWSDYIHDIDRKMVDLKTYDRLSLFEILRAIGEEPGERNPLFDTIFNFIDFHVFAGAKQVDTRDAYKKSLSEELASFVSTNTLLDFTVNTTFGNFLLTVRYSGPQFSCADIENLCRYFRKVLEKSINRPGELAGKDKILSGEERETLLYRFNATETDYPGEKVIHRLFAEQAGRTPENIAVTAGESRLTYGELDEKSNDLAHLLKKKGIKENTIVGIMAEPSPEMMVGILGILKAGGAYLPIDPEYPRERIDFLLKDSGAKILLSKSSRVSGLSKEPTHLTHLTHPTQLCYVIYTSGTTGKPKGVMLTHKNLVNYVSWFVNEARIRENDKTILTSSFAFDLGYTSIYPSILSGAELHILAREEYLADEYLLGYIKKEGITYLKLTPSFFTIIANSPDFSPGICPALRLVVLGGEAVNAVDVEKAHRICPHIEFINHYGPTEATIGCIAQYIDFNTIAGYKKQPGIGHPIHNMKAYILDKRLNPLPMGVPGELCLSGVNIARGYLNRPELTAEKFIFSSYRSYRSYRTYISKKIYKTGDLARWLPDGTIEFLGRFDHQVKIRGYRIELGEIQEQLLKHENVEDAVVLALEDRRKMKYLCAYIVPVGMDIDPGEEPGIPGLKLQEYLSRHLPGYMVPAHVVKIEKVPLTPNGKLDTRTLPLPEFDAGAGYRAPRDPLEKKLVELWAGLLESGVGRIGIDDNFFQLGGHSISAAILLSRIHKDFSVKLPLAELFKNPTVKGLAHIIKGMQREKYMLIKPAAEKEYYNLSSAQKRVYFFQQMEPSSSSYNLTAVVILEGELEKERLEHTFKQLIRRHESLRTSIQLVEDEPVLKIHRDVEFEVEYIEEKTGNIGELVGAFVRSFALNAAPLLRVALVKLEQTRHLLMVDMHHIISDGLSRRIFLKELSALYAGKELPGLSLTFKDYTEWQDNEAGQERIKRQGEFWINEFAGEIPILDLPTDYERPATRSLEGDTVYFELDREESGQLKEIAYKVNATIFMVLLAVYSILLSKLSGDDDIIVGCPVTGRGHADLEPIIGMFVNMVALRNFPQGHKTFRNYLNEVRERTVRAFENQDYPFEELVDRIKINRTANRNPIFDVCFSMQGMEILEVEMGGVTLKPYEFQEKYARFDMAFVVDESEERLKFGVEYSTKLFKTEMIERFINYFKEIVSMVVSNQDILLKDVLISHDLLTSSSAASLEAESDFGF